MSTPRLGHIKYVLGRAKRQSRANAAEIVAALDLWSLATNGTQEMFGGLGNYYIDRQIILKAKKGTRGGSSRPDGARGAVAAFPSNYSVK